MKSTTRLWLDDERPAPDETWTVFKTAHDIISFMLSAECCSWSALTISLDHDLGGPEAGTGYDVVCEIERCVHGQAAAGMRIHAPKITVHSANPVGRQRIVQGIKSIEAMQRDQTK